MRRYLLVLFAILIAVPNCLAADTIVEPTLRRGGAAEPTFDLKRKWPPNLREGSATIDFIVNAEGKVTEMHASKAAMHEMIQPALLALKKWRFKPATANGKAVSAIMRVDIWFGVSDQPKTVPRETPPVFVSLGEKLHMSTELPDVSELYITTEAARHMDKLQANLPADLSTGDSNGKTIVEPYAILTPAPLLRREILEKTGGTVKFRVAAIVRPDGKPSDYYILSSSAPEANRAMASAMSQWTYSAGTVNGKAASFLFAMDYTVGE